MDLTSASPNNQPYSQEAYRELSRRINANLRFQAGIHEFGEMYPELVPMSWQKLADRIPLGAVLGFAQLARAIGVGSLREPWFYLILVLMDYDFRQQLPDDLKHSARLKFRRPRNLQRDIGWFYKRFCEQKTAVAIADREGYSQETVEKGILRARMLLGITKRRGRPPRSHYAA